MIIALLFAIIGVLILGLIVFGGGQIFMPLFKSLWQLMDHHGAHITDQKINNVFTIANSTPGVVSTKFALITGYLTADGAWWGWLAMFLTYLVFAIPSIIMVWWAAKLVNNSEKSKHLKLMTKYLKPVVAGIVIALAIQLFIGTAFPHVVFNNGVHNYMGIDKTTIQDGVTTQYGFFQGWRLWVLIPYSIIVTIESAYLYAKGKASLFLLIVIHIVIGLVIFEPWLA